MPVERRGQVTGVGIDRSTGNGRNRLVLAKAVAFIRWHEPDESRGSRPVV